MNWMLRQTVWMDRIANIVGRYGSFLILPLIFVIMFDVVTRKFQFLQQAIQSSWLHDFISPTKLQELEWHLHAAVFFLAYAMTYLANAHVRVDVLRETFSKRRQAWIELIGLLVFAVPYLLVVIWFGWDFVARAYQSGEGSSALTGLPNRWIIKSFLLIGVGMTLMVVFSVIIKLVAYLFGPPETHSRADELLNIFPVEAQAEIEEISALTNAGAQDEIDHKGSAS